MSTSFRTEPPIQWDALWADLPDGVTEHVDSQVTETRRCLTNGAGYLWAYKLPSGETDFEVWSSLQNGQAARFILEALSEKHDVLVLSEHDEGYFDGIEEEEEEVSDG